MEATTPLPSQPEIQILAVLRQTYVERKERNKAYSLTAFAKDLGISKSILSRILSGDRAVSVKLAMHLTACLDLSDIEGKKILLNVLQSQSKNAKIQKKLKEQLEKQLKIEVEREVHSFTHLEIEQFKAMCSWYHLAILNLVELKSFKNDVLWIAKKLAISTMEARDGLERLFSLGLLEEKGNKLFRTKKSIYIKTVRSELAIRKFHEQMINKASEELKSVEQARFEKRLINGITFTCTEDQIPLIKQKIDQFQDEILAMTSNVEATELYQMNVQFFPLTKQLLYRRTYEND